MTSQRTTLPDFEVALFLKEIAPGKSQKEIALILGVNAKTVSRWVQTGMPMSKARELVGWRVGEMLDNLVEIARMKQSYGL